MASTRPRRRSHLRPAHRGEPGSRQDGGGNDLDAFLVEERHDPAFRAAYEDAEHRSRLLHRLIQIRQERGLSQTAVARHMGTTQSAVSDLESQGTDPRLSTLQRYARALGLRIFLGIGVNDDSGVPMIPFFVPGPDM